MDSTLTIRLRITHTRNLPRAQSIADIAAMALTEVLAADPQLLASATLVSTDIQSDDKAPALRLPGPYANLR